MIFREQISLICAIYRLEIFDCNTHSTFQFCRESRLELDHSTFAVVALYKNFLTVLRRPSTRLPSSRGHVFQRCEGSMIALKRYDIGIFII